MVNDVFISCFLCIWAVTVLLPDNLSFLEGKYISFEIAGKPPAAFNWATPFTVCHHKRFLFPP